MSTESQPTVATELVIPDMDLRVRDRAAEHLGDPFQMHLSDKDFRYNWPLWGSESDHIGRCAGCDDALSGPQEHRWGVCESCTNHPHPHAGGGSR